MRSCTTVHAAAEKSGAFISTTGLRQTAHAFCAESRLRWHGRHADVLPHRPLKSANRYRPRVESTGAGARIDTLVCSWMRRKGTSWNCPGRTRMSSSKSSKCENGASNDGSSACFQKRVLKPGTAKVVTWGWSAKGAPGGSARAPS